MTTRERLERAVEFAIDTLDAFDRDAETEDEHDAELSGEAEASD